MQSDQQQYHGCGRVMNSYENHVGFDISANNAVGVPLERNVSSHRMELQPPENYFIFNQTGYKPYPTSMENNNGKEVEKEISSPFTEDPDEINALLSLDNDEQAWESEEEEVSTARTNGYDGSSSPESSCNYSTKSKKTKLSSSSRNSHGEGSSSSCNNERKRKKMQKMVNVLRGIVPGGQRLSTSAVLDEAVKYLKSLKVEVEQNGVDDT